MSSRVLYFKSTTNCSRHRQDQLPTKDAAEEVVEEELPKEQAEQVAAHVGQVHRLP
jgi:hypothetical protein